MPAHIAPDTLGGYGGSMKNKLLILIATALLSLGSAYAHGDKHSEEKKDTVIKGQLVGMTCFVKHNSKGASHEDCFKECAKKGLPIGILTKDNVIFQISGKGHEDLVETNKKFLKYAEKDVIAKGETFSSNGVNMIVVKGIKKAN